MWHEQAGRHRRISECETSLALQQDRAHLVGNVV